jgi:hypothetical protein
VKNCATIIILIVNNVKKIPIAKTMNAKHAMMHVKRDI